MLKKITFMLTVMLLLVAPKAVFGFEIPMNMDKDRNLNYIKEHMSRTFQMELNKEYHLSDKYKNSNYYTFVPEESGYIDVMCLVDNNRQMAVGVYNEDGTLLRSEFMYNYNTVEKAYDIFVLKNHTYYVGGAIDSTIEGSSVFGLLTLKFTPIEEIKGSLRPEDINGNLELDRSYKLLSCKNRSNLFKFKFETDNYYTLLDSECGNGLHYSLRHIDSDSDEELNRDGQYLLVPNTEYDIEVYPENISDSDYRIDDFQLNYKEWDLQNINWFEDRRINLDLHGFTDDCRIMMSNSKSKVTDIKNKDKNVYYVPMKKVKSGNYELPKQVIKCNYKYLNIYVQLDNSSETELVLTPVRNPYYKKGVKSKSY